MAAQPGADVVGQGVVDGGFHFAVEGQAAPFGQFLTGRRFGAVADVVGQRLRVPGSKHRLGGEVLLSGIGIRPFLPATVAGGAGGETVHQRRLLAQPHQAGAPAAQHGRIQHHHALGQFRCLRRSHQAEDATHGMAEQVAWLVLGLRQRVAEIDQLLHHVVPVVADRVAGIVPVLVQRMHLVALLFELVEQHAVGAGGKAVAVREDDLGGRGTRCFHQITLSSGDWILVMGG